MSQGYHVGRHGTAMRIEVAPEGSAEETLVGAWLLNSPGWVPTHSHYALQIVSLEDSEAFPPSVRIQPENEYELVVCALDPQWRPVATDRETLCPILPFDVMVQFGGVTREQAASVGWEAAKAVCDGALPLETKGNAGAHERWEEAVRSTIRLYQEQQSPWPTVVDAS